MVIMLSDAMVVVVVCWGRRCPWLVRKGVPDLIPYNRVEKQLMVVEEEEDIIDADGEDFEEEQVKKWLAVAWLSSGQTYVIEDLFSNMSRVWGVHDAVPV